MIPLYSSSGVIEFADRAREPGVDPVAHKRGAADLGTLLRP